MVNIQVRVDEHLRDQAQQILSQIGMDMTTALTSSPPNLWTTHPLSSGLPLFLIPELRAVSGNLRQPEVKCFAA